MYKNFILFTNVNLVTQKKQAALKLNRSTKLKVCTTVRLTKKTLLQVGLHSIK